MKVVELSNIEFIKIDLTDNYNRLMENIFNKIPNNIKGNSKIARANTKARLRMCIICNLKLSQLSCSRNR